MIARHRRKAAAQWAGLAEVPAVIRELDDNQAIVAMVDSNLQRENLKPSEKAFAYASLKFLFRFSFLPTAPPTACADILLISLCFANSFAISPIAEKQQCQ